MGQIGQAGGRIHDRTPGDKTARRWLRREYRECQRFSAVARRLKIYNQVKSPKP
ncbi:hypothetical protein D554_2207 [Bordetella holmesii 30539]|uniref:N-acetyltransferase YedL n=1 Tax=Bordetella holmesii 1058 TaxID=1247648 RepID=A0ABP3BJA8_9BORD|nr:hypothetical protein D560_0489 [Bordetella holmesii ATCC 51541]AIT25173.1 hypothetical protein D558_0484 [Bordetella holmesii 44057]EWM45739.1 hypothetical protein D557_3747 [Bordetella holmesii 70147]EWM48388.1 hypothetical protein D556_0485 [Bordetella holmesii 41130]EWM49867.1 hypothetical protein D555_0495 [Bordetella holmesii 35009]EXF86954.1 hypothetical protein D554_2207 [Bordetella holmesii 30539]EXX95021.1 hypothetical protein D559_2448 [Bordetella holmesii 1058]